MVSRALSCLAALLFVGTTLAQDTGAQLEAVVKEKEELAKQVATLKAQLAAAKDGTEPPADLPLRILNNASNNVTLANCLESYEVQAGEDIATTFLTGAFWVLPDGADFNCSQGCSDCFYVKMEWTEKDGISARIGFGVEDTKAVGSPYPEQPQGGGLKLSVSGGGSAQCTDESCEAGWTNPLSVNAESSTVSLTIEGSKLAEGTTANGTVSMARLGRGRIGRIGGIGRFRRPVFRRPIYRRPIWRRPVWRRPIYRRPIFRPIYRPIYAPAPTCAWCNQFGAGTCSWLCR